MMEGEFNIIKLKTKVGSSPGDMASEWWTEEDWQHYNKKVEQSKIDGTYGDEVEMTIYIKPLPLFNNPWK